MAPELKLRSLGNKKRHIVACSPLLSRHYHAGNNNIGPRSLYPKSTG